MIPKRGPVRDHAPSIEPRPFLLGAVLASRRHAAHPDSPHRTLADRRQLHDLARRQDRSRGGGRGDCPTARSQGAANACLMRATARRSRAWSRRSRRCAERARAGSTRAALQGAMPAGAARNALDCAFWDFDAKASARPAHALAGLAEPAPLVTAYTISLGTPETMAEAAGKAAARKLLKVKLGGEGDPARIRAVRKAAPNSELIVDANEAWRADNLADNLAACADAGVTLVEQPLPAGDDPALAPIKRPIPVCADESVHDRASLRFARRQIRRGQHQARQDRRIDRGAGDGARGRAARLRAHGRLHGGDIVVDGARDAAGATRARGRSRRTAAARARSRARAALRRQPGLSGDVSAVG